MVEPGTVALGTLASIAGISGYGAMKLNAKQSKDIRDAVNAQCRANDMLLKQTENARQLALREKAECDQEVEKLKQEVATLQNEKQRLAAAAQQLRGRTPPADPAAPPPPPDAPPPPPPDGTATAIEQVVVPPPDETIFTGVNPMSDTTSVAPVTPTSSIDPAVRDSLRGFRSPEAARLSRATRRNRTPVGPTARIERGTGTRRLVPGVAALAAPGVVSGVPVDVVGPPPGTSGVVSGLPPNRIGAPAGITMEEFERRLAERKRKTDEMIRTLGPAPTLTEEQLRVIAQEQADHEAFLRSAPTLDADALARATAEGERLAKLSTPVILTGIDSAIAPPPIASPVRPPGYIDGTGAPSTIIPAASVVNPLAQVRRKRVIAPSPPDSPVAVDPAAGTGLFSNEVMNIDPAQRTLPEGVPDGREFRLEKADQAIKIRETAVKAARGSVRVFNMTGRKMKSVYDGAIAVLKTPLDIQTLLAGLSGPDVDERMERLRGIEETARETVEKESAAPAPAVSDIAARNPPLPPSPFGKATRKGPGELFGSLPGSSLTPSQKMMAKKLPKKNGKGGLRKKKLRTRRGVKQNVGRSRGGKNRSDRAASHTRRRS